MRRVHPEGPYCLGGYCLGGMVAYEMARVLQNQGEEVALLALLDSYNVSSLPETRLGGSSQLFQRLRFHLGNVARLRPGDIARYLVSLR